MYYQLLLLCRYREVLNARSRQSKAKKKTDSEGEAATVPGKSRHGRPRKATSGGVTTDDVSATDVSFNNVTESR